MHRDSYMDGRFHQGHRMRRGDMAPVILRLLNEKPMHGYEIISKLEEQTHGMWRPSAGSVYPNLQLLEEQDLVTSKNEGGKKVYSLTAKGQEEANRVEEHFKSRWQERENQAKNFKDLKSIFFDAMGYVRQISAQDSDEKNTKVKAILTEARDKLSELAKND